MSIEHVRVGVIPAGALGSAFAKLAAERGYEVTIYFHHPESLQEFERKHKSPRLKGIPLLGNVHGTCNIREVVEGSNVIFFAPPSEKVPEVFEKVEPILEDQYFISGSKGLIQGKNSNVLTMSQYILEKKPRLVDQLVVMSGPNLAREMALHKETGTLFVSYNTDTAKRLQSLFYTDSFRIYTEEDVVGAEAGGSLKNIIAFGAGAGAAFRVSQNTQALYITRGLAEITRLGMALGAKDERTFSGLSGLGDIVVSSVGKGSRNKRAGKAFALGQSAETLSSSGILVEALHTVKIAATFARKHGVDAPITELIDRALRGEIKASECIRYLMSRQPTREFNGVRSLRFAAEQLGMIAFYRARGVLS